MLLLLDYNDIIRACSHSELELSWPHILLYSMDYSGSGTRC